MADGLTPYDTLSHEAFWKACREAPDFAADRIYAPKFEIGAGTRVATAGSCFAQNIGRYLSMTDADLLQVEPAPDGMLPETARTFGYGLYSARYGNIYTARQLRQLVQDAQVLKVRDDAIWQRDGRYFDALRPAIEPDGVARRGFVREMRVDHLKRVYAMFGQMDVLVFTLGLTEHWENKRTGTTYPSCPGVIAGQFDPEIHGYCNASYPMVSEDLCAALTQLRAVQPDLKVLLTVSPVPLTATASGRHVLAATTYSKSVLRAVAGALAEDHDWIDYFPSYELITGAPFKAISYAENCRQVTEEGVAFVMKHFFAAQSGLQVLPGVAAQISSLEGRAKLGDPFCEDVLLDAFSR